MKVVLCVGTALTYRLFQFVDNATSFELPGLIRICQMRFNQTANRLPASGSWTRKILSSRIKLQQFETPISGEPFTVDRNVTIDTHRMLSHLNNAAGGGKDSIGAMIAPANGYRGHLARRGIKPRDHQKENRMALRQKQQQNRLKVMDDAARPTRDFKMKRFHNVQSRIDQSNPSDGQQERQNRDFVKEKREFLRKDQGLNAAKVEHAPAVDNSAYRNRQAAKPRVPKAALAERTTPREQKDYIRQNNAAAAAQPLRRKSRDAGRRVPAHRNGEVPEYLNRRKQEVAEAKFKRENVDRDCPPGMTLMDDADRRDTLQTLRSSKKEAENQLMKMPLNIHTLAQKQRQEQLEGQLKEIESAILIFNKPKVYIADD